MEGLRTDCICIQHTGHGIFKAWKVGTRWNLLHPSFQMLKQSRRPRGFLIKRNCNVQDYEEEALPGSIICVFYGVKHMCPSSFPGGSDGKEVACSAGDPGSVSGSGRFPGEGRGNPLQHSCLGNPMDRGNFRAIVHGVAKSQTRLND